MRQGITVWLDVPLDALARRIAAVGTDSRPLIQFESGDPYTKVGILSSLSTQLLAYCNNFLDLLTKIWFSVPTVQQAFMGLFTLSRKRTEAYSHADARVSLQRISSMDYFFHFSI